MKRWITLIIFVVALGGAIAWRMQTKIASQAQLAKATQLRKQSSANVVMASAAPGDILEHVDVVGDVETPFDMKLAAKVAGVVEYLNVRSGDNVKSGEVLVRINKKEQEGQVLQYQGALAEAKQRYSQALLTQNPTNTQVYTQISTQKAAVASAQANENQTVQNYNSTVAAAQAAVTDAQAKVSAAEATLAGANQGVISAQANYKDAAAKYERTYSLYQQGYIAPQSVDDAKAAQDMADAAVGAAQQTKNADSKAVESAQAELSSAEDQLSIAKKKGQSDIVAAKAATRQAQEALKYASSNRGQIPAYQANLDALKATVDSTQGQLENAIGLMADTELKIPFDGTVTSRMIDPGSMASVGQELLEVQYLDWLFVVCSAPIEDSNAIKVGQTASLTFDALPGQKFTAVISSVTPAADLTSRQFSFRMKLENKQRMFKPGMYGHVDIVTKADHVDILVPHEAVHTDNTGSTVSVVDDKNVVHTTTVTLGISDPVNVQILTGLKPGDKVVTLSYQPIKDGTKVHGQAAGQGAAPPSGGPSGSPSTSQGTKSGA